MSAVATRAPVLETTERGDAVAWLTGYLVLLLFVPSRLVVGPLGSAGAPSMLFGLASLVLWTVLLLRSDRTQLGPTQPVRLGLVLFLASVGVSYVLAMSRPLDGDEASPANVAMLALASWAGTLLLTHDAIQDRRRIDTLVWRIAVCGGLIAALGLFQIATRRLWVDQLSIPGLSSSPSYSLSARGGYPRPAGTSIHPIEYGVLLAVILPLALHVAFHHLDRRPLVRWLPAAALLAVIPVTSSRSAYLGALIALAVSVVGWPRRRRLVGLGVGVAGIAALGTVAPNFVGSIVGLFAASPDDPSIVSRTDSFALAFEFVGRHPWFGRGLGTFLPKYRIFDNEYLLLLVTVGVVGLVCFLVLGALAFGATARLRRRLPDEASRDLALALCAAIAAGFACLVMFDAFAFPMTMGALFLVVGLAGCLRRVALASTDEVGRP